jgi:hypothetical protein
VLVYCDIVSAFSFGRLISLLNSDVVGIPDSVTYVMIGIMFDFACSIDNTLLFARPLSGGNSVSVVYGKWVSSNVRKEKS